MKKRQFLHAREYKSLDENLNLLYHLVIARIMCTVRIWYAFSLNPKKQANKIRRSAEKKVRIKLCEILLNVRM